MKRQGRRSIFHEPAPAGIKDPWCWLAALLLWVCLFNAPAIWQLIHNFVRYVLFLGKTP